MCVCERGKIGRAICRVTIQGCAGQGEGEDSACRLGAPVSTAKDGEPPGSAARLQGVGEKKGVSLPSFRVAPPSPPPNYCRTCGPDHLRRVLQHVGPPGQGSGAGTVRSPAPPPPPGTPQKAAAQQPPRSTPTSPQLSRREWAAAAGQITVGGPLWREKVWRLATRGLGNNHGARA